MPTKKIEDDPAVFQAAEQVFAFAMGKFTHLSPEQKIETMFTVLVGIAVAYGWNYEAFEKWFRESAEVSYKAMAQVS